MERKSKKIRTSKHLKGRYTNYFEVGHNAFEFLFDFGEFYDEDSNVRFHTRIVTAPTYATALLETLRGSIDHYEQSFGMIPKPEDRKTEPEGE